MLNSLVSSILFNGNNAAPLTDLEILNGGSNYVHGSYSDVPLINLTGSGSGATADLVISEGGGVLAAETVSEGQDYTIGSYSEVELEGGSGSGAKISFNVVQGGGVLEVQILDRGEDYTAGTYAVVPSISLDGIGSGAGFVVNISAGKLPEGIIVQSPGTGYVDGYYTNVRTNNITGIGSGLTLDISVIGGEVSSIAINVTGELYDIDDIIEFEVEDMGGAGSGASGKITAVSGLGVIYSVTIANQGENYVAGNRLTFNAADIGGTGSGFEMSINSATGIGSIDSNSISFDDRGQGYGIGNSLTISDPSGGSGFGFELSVTNLTDMGVVTEATINSSGNNYRVGNTFTIDNSEVGGTGSGLVLRANSVSSGTGNVTSVTTSSSNKIPVATDSTGRTIKFSDVTLQLVPETGNWAITSGLQTIFLQPQSDEQFLTYDVGNVIGGTIGSSVQSTSASPVRLIEIPIVGTKVINISGVVNAAWVGGDSGVAGDQATFNINLGGKIVSDVITIGTLDLNVLYRDQAAWTVAAIVDGGSVVIEFYGDDDMIVDATGLFQLTFSNVD